jgi:hypothetical protein
MGDWEVTEGDWVTDQVTALCKIPSKVWFWRHPPSIQLVTHTHTHTAPRFVSFSNTHTHTHTHTPHTQDDAPSVLAGLHSVSTALRDMQATLSRMGESRLYVTTCNAA